MKYYLLIFFIILFSCCKNEASNLNKNKGSDKEIVFTVAEKKWKEVYGKSAINKQKPFVGEKENDSIWIVRGTLPKSVIGGLAYAEVNVKKHKVIKYTHGE